MTTGADEKTHIAARCQCRGLAEFPACGAGEGKPRKKKKKKKGVEEPRPNYLDRSDVYVRQACNGRIGRPKGSNVPSKANIGTKINKWDDILLGLCYGLAVAT